MSRYFKYGLFSVVAVFLCVATATVLANGFYTPPPAPLQAPYFTGYYVGIGTGIVHAHANTNAEGSGYLYNSDIQQNGDFYYLNKSHNFDIGKFGFKGNMFAGYGKTFEASLSYYLGGEIFGNYFSPTMKGSSYSLNKESSVPLESLMSIDTKIENPSSFGGDVRAGYLVAPRTMVYVLLGLDYARFKVKSEFSYQTFTQPEVDGHIAHDFNKWKLGYMPGVGIETSLIDNISLRAQFTYTFYSSFSYNSTLEYVPLQPGPPPHKESLTTKFKPSRGLFTIELSYLFN